MKREYHAPQTEVATACAVTMLCASTPSPSYENKNKGGGDPVDAI